MDRIRMARVLRLGGATTGTPLPETDMLRNTTAALLAAAALLTPNAAQAGWDWEWETSLSQDLADRALTWAEAASPEGLTKATIMSDYMPPLEAEFCPLGGCEDEGELMLEWATYFFGLAEGEPLPAGTPNYPLGCVEECYW